MMYALFAVGAIAALIAAAATVAALRPSDFIISRSERIAATPAELFPYISNLRKFQEWNPYKDKDPNAKNEFSGPDEGPGAVFHWTGDGHVGEGIMTIERIVPDERVNIDLEFIKPFPGHNAVEFSLTPDGDATVVTWSMAGKYAFMPKLFGLVMNLDQMIGGDFETGLKRLKTFAEK